MTKSNRKVQLSILVAGVVAWAVVIIRAWILPITIDEAATYFEFVQDGVFIPPFSKWEANNHILNSMLSWVFTSLFGSSAFTLRLANVCFFPLFIYSIYMLSKSALKTNESRLFLAATLLGSPFLLEFFSLSRGYGMSTALLALFIVNFLEAMKPEKKGLLGLAALGFIMNLANLNLLLIYLMALAILVLQTRKVEFRRVASLALWAAFVGVLVWYAFGLKSRGLLYYGCFAYLAISVKYSTFLYVGTSWLSYYFVPLCALVLFVFLSRFKSLLVFQPTWVLSALSLGAIFGPVVQHMLLDTPLPQDRTYLHAMVLLLITTAFCIDSLGRVLKWVAMLYSLLVPIAGLSNFELQKSQLWPDQRMSDQLVEELEKFENEAGRMPRVLSNVRSAANWYFLNEMHDKNYLIQPWETYQHQAATADFLLLDRKVRQEELTVAADKVVDKEHDDFVLYRLNKHRVADRIDTQMVAEVGKTKRTFIDLWKSSSGDTTSLVIVEAELFLQMERIPQELYVVLVEKDEDGEKERCTRINLTDFQNSGWINGERPFRFTAYFETSSFPDAGIYLWNTSSSEIILDGAELKVFAYFDE